MKNSRSPGSAMPVPGMAMRVLGSGVPAIWANYDFPALGKPQTVKPLNRQSGKTEDREK